MWQHKVIQDTKSKSLNISAKDCLVMPINMGINHMIFLAEHWADPLLSNLFAILYIRHSVLNPSVPENLLARQISI